MTIQRPCVTGRVLLGLWAVAVSYCFLALPGRQHLPSSVQVCGESGEETRARVAFVAPSAPPRQQMMFLGFKRGFMALSFPRLIKNRIMVGSVSLELSLSYCHIAGPLKLSEKCPSSLVRAGHELCKLRLARGLRGCLPPCTECSCREFKIDRMGWECAPAAACSVETLLSPLTPAVILGHLASDEPDGHSTRLSERMR